MNKMSIYSRCKICGYSTNGNFNTATMGTKCNFGSHIFEEFVYCPRCHSNTVRLENAVDSMFCSIECQNIYATSKKPRILKVCQICGKTSSSSRCPSCEDNILNEQRKEIRDGFQTEVGVFDEFKHCKYGVCDIVKAHHNVLQDDPERLKSEFIINLVCGSDGKEFYIERRALRVGHRRY